MIIRHISEYTGDKGTLQIHLIVFIYEVAKLRRGNYKAFIHAVPVTSELNYRGLTLHVSGTDVDDTVRTLYQLATKPGRLTC